MHATSPFPRPGYGLSIGLAIVILLVPSFGRAEQLPSLAHPATNALADELAVATPSWLFPSGRSDVVLEPRFVSGELTTTHSVLDLTWDQTDANVADLVTYSQAEPQRAQPPLSEQEKLGQAPEDFSQQFLRQESVLLKPGQWQLDIGISYTLFQHDYTRGVINELDGSLIGLLDSRFKSRLLLVPMEVRYGVTDRIQAFVNVPFGWSNTEDSFFSYDDFSNHVGIGDVTAGLSVLLHRSGGLSCDPSVIATVACTAPTADVSPLQGILEPPNTVLGQGLWFGSWNVLFVHTIDPIIVFYGFGGRHSVSREYHGFDVRYGDQYIYRGGIGFAVNERVTLNASVNGSYITDPYLDGNRVQGLALEPISLRFGATIANYCYRRFWDPFVEIGMTPDAPDARVGMTFTY